MLPHHRKAPPLMPSPSHRSWLTPCFMGVVGFLTLLGNQPAVAQSPDTPTLSQPQAMSESVAEHESRMQWWRDARFGMFIHWGLYAIPAGTWEGKDYPGNGEWILEKADIPIDEYVKLGPQFNPAKYDPKAWAKAMKHAGMKYVVITSRHHDGFALFDSQTSDFDVVDATPYGKDLLQPLADACRAEGIKFCVYYSIMDWYHPSQTREPHTTKMLDGQKEEYVLYMKSQLKELIEGCSPEVMWFDGEWTDWWTEEDGIDLYNYLRELKPSLIVNNRVGKGRKGMGGFSQKDRQYVGDFGTPEQQIPATGISDVDWESCMTMNDTWGFKTNDQNWKSSKTLLHNLIDITSKGGNYLLNVGPTAEGEIPSASLERLQEMGDWMQSNGESIYQTTASPFANLPWGRCTQKPGKLYLHVFDMPSDRVIRLPNLKNQLGRATLLVDSKVALPVTQQKGEIQIDCTGTPEVPLSKYALVVVLEIDGRVEMDSPPLSK